MSAVSSDHLLSSWTSIRAEREVPAQPSAPSPISTALLVESQMQMAEQSVEMDVPEETGAAEPVDLVLESRMSAATATSTVQAGQEDQCMAETERQNTPDACCVPEQGGENEEGWVQLTDDEVLTEEQYIERLRQLQQEWDEASVNRLREQNQLNSMYDRALVEEEREQAIAAAASAAAATAPTTSPFFTTFVNRLIATFPSVFGTPSRSSSAPSRSAPPVRECTCLGGPYGFHRQGCFVVTGYVCDCLGASVGIHHTDCPNHGA